MNVFKNLRLSTRIFVVGLLPLLCFACLQVWLGLRIQTLLYDTRREATMHQVQSAWGVLNFYGSEANAGRMTVAQAQASAKRALKGLRYGQDGYFWVNDLGPSMVMHPINPSLDGHDLTHHKDPNGLSLFVKMAEVCRSRGEGLVEYMWAKPGAIEPVPKISFVKLYKPWGWIVGSGIYVDDVWVELKSILWILLGAGAIASVLSLSCAYFLARAIAGQIHGVVKDLMGGADEITSAAAQITSSSRSLALGATDQAASLQETSTASQEIALITQRNSETSKSAAGDIGETSEFVSEANCKLDEMIHCMHDIDASGDKVIRIIKVIDEIAFLTNILALNAAVEAARAGEAGMGFAVVAGEVRNLAQRCTIAAKETEALIEQSVSMSKMGGAKLSQVASVVEDITRRTARTKTHVDEVYVGSQEQATGIGKLAAAIVQIERVTQQTAAMAEQSAAAGEEMSAHAESVRSAIRSLEALVKTT